jgi:aspartate aminotransferase
VEELAELLERASARIGHRIYLLSDEPYRRLRFDDLGFDSPATVYPWTLISYSYGKVLLSPGQRLGYLAISPLMPSEDRDSFRESLVSAQMALGWCFPNAIMQYSVPDLETLSIDQLGLTRRRSMLMDAFNQAGYAFLKPEGTFYLWSKWPDGDPDAHWNALADRNVFVMPGSIMNQPDYFRISLTASDRMVERAQPAFQEIAGT